MLRIGQLGIASLLAIGGAAPSSAYHVVFDAGLVGTSTATFVSVGSVCGMVLQFPSFTGAFQLGGGVGAGSNARLENGEEIEVVLPAAARGVTYQVSAAVDLDGNGTNGESFVEAFDANQVTLGVVPVSGTGEKNVTALFGGVAIQQYTVTSGEDGIRLRRFGYDLPAGVELETFLSGVPGTAPFAMASFEQCSATIRGIPRDVYASSSGLSVAGGDADLWQDGDEDLEIEFPEPVVGAAYELGDAVDVDGGTIGGHFVEAFDASGASLGMRSASDVDPIELADPAFFGATPISRFVLIGVADQIRLRNLFFAPEPESGAAFAALALASLAAARRRRRSPH